MSLISNVNSGVFCKPKLVVNGFVIVCLLGILFLFSGCVKMEATRKADWETHFTDLHFVNHRQGWIVGEGGLIIHTADGGKTWKQQEVDTTSPGFRMPDASLDFKAVYFTNADNGWAVGDEGLIATTDDGGRHWSLQKSGSSAMLLDVFFANSKQGWIVGEDSDVLYTKNGGKEWKRYEYVSEFMLNGVWFVDNSKGWVVGTHDRIFYTENGGESWREQSNRFEGERDRMINDNKQVFFISDNEGWIVGSDGSIFHTTTAGANWERQDSRIPLINGHVRDTINSIHFTDENYGVAVADVGFITRTEDGGDNWQLMESGTENNLTGIQFTTPTEAWAVGWYGTILHTTDAGATWEMTSGTTANDLQNVQFTDANRAIAVGRRGTMAMSNDGGQTWNEIETDIWDGIWNIYFATDKHGWAVGERGLIVHTNDGGMNWERQRGPTAFTLRSVHFVSPQMGWIVGDIGSIIHTIDGGETWLPQTATGDFFSLMLKGVFFLNEKKGWAIGWPGVCLATEDGGLTWNQQTTGTFNELYAVYFADENTGWIVGQFGEILHTKNGGKKWNFQRSGTQENLNKLYFADKQHGLVVGDNGVMLTTINGGKKWEMQESGTDNDLYGLALSPDGVVAVGKGGIAMRYSVEEAQLPAKLPPVAEEPEIVAVEEEAPVEPVAYHWDIIRQAAWRTDFADTHFVDAQNGWAVGSGGVIAHTTDGGQTWFPQHSGVSENLREVKFVDANHGRALGSGTLLQTENGGETWQPILQATKQNLPRVSTMHFLNAEEGWLGASIGQTLHTTDGGKTWKVQKTGTTTGNITDLHFINSQVGWAVTPQRRDGGFILHTVDGGDYWKIQAKTNQPGIAVHFADENRGWVILGNGNSLLTEDGGETWQLKTTSQSTRGLRRVTFRSHTKAWGLGGGGAYITEDQGVNWKVIPVATRDDILAMRQPDPEIPEEPAPEIKKDESEDEVAEGPTLEYDETPEEIQNRLRAEQQRPGRLAPEGALPPNAERATPAPAQQQPPPPPEPRGRRRGGRRIASVYFLDTVHAWAVGSAGSIYYSADGGKTWERQLGEQERSDFREVLFYDDKNGWIAGDEGMLLETQDGGETWQKLRTQTRQRFIGVHFASMEPKWGWAMQRDGTVIYTTDGNIWTAGDTPERPPFMEGDSPGNFSLNDVAFGKFSEGWAVGQFGDIIHNKDGGPTWTLQRTTANDRLTSVDMKFAPLGWAVGQGGVTQRTINGGQYWRMHETKTNYDLNAVSFISKRKGWAAGEAGIVLRTIDGGFTWEPILTGIPKDLHGIVALSEQEVYAVGNEGTIVRSTDGGETWEQEHTDIDNNLYVITRSKGGKALWVVGQWGVVLRRKLERRRYRCGRLCRHTFCVDNSEKLDVGNKIYYTLCVMGNFNLVDLFAGIGGIRIPFEKLGGTCVFSSEWDKHAQETYAHNFGEIPAGDITKIDEAEIPDHDILLAGFPCQPFSIIGDKQGFEDTRGTLFFDIVRILKQKQPSAFLLENVKQLLTHDKGQTFAIIQEQLTRLGYTIYHKVLNALDFGLPQKRERIFMIGFREPIAFAFPKPIGPYKPLSEILEPDEDVKPNLSASARIQQSRREKCKGTPFFPSIWHENKGGNISVLPFSCALRAGASYNYLLVNGIRRLSGREMLRLQGFPEDFKIVGNMMQIRKQTGNSVAIPVVHAIAEKMLQALEQRKPMIRPEEQLLLFQNRINAYA